MIIHHTGQLIRRDAIVPPDNKIAEVFTGDEALKAARAVDKRNFFAIGNAKAPIHPGSDRNIFNAFRAASARVERFFLASVRGLQSTQHILPGTGAWINQTECL